MERKTSGFTRNRFVIWAAGIVASFTVFRFFGPSKAANTRKTKTIKMLTRDGKLVEIDEALLNTQTRKVTDEELQSWVKK